MAGGQVAHGVRGLGQRVGAVALIDSYVYGFALSEAALPITGPTPVAEVAEAMTRRFADGAHPHLLEFSIEHVMKPGYDFGEEFEFGLGLVLDALATYAPTGGRAPDGAGGSTGP